MSGYLDFEAPPPTCECDEMDVEEGIVLDVVRCSTGECRAEGVRGPFYRLLSRVRDPHPHAGVVPMSDRFVRDLVGVWARVAVATIPLVITLFVILAVVSSLTSDPMWWFIAGVVWGMILDEIGVLLRPWVHGGDER
ncbi:hypothetical protein Hrd1104_00040 [Halorhabdus sp. CBA1104]|uniref:hypothetical protein n=1 Tax=Halorhabdus sp. CBA1104 TaxID=1380432 RepID=UPI0012B418E6|nr:hypothetical protein [Halorhabdus sp. CBA1104]QGN05835.1 hypothetical protein Hrd1104_00040 [Halorhabdus sp. CBA1104]